ncbi:hypothetical protein VPAG_00007 [Vibrio phage douglas 12A4]|uniref:hypothetical protein n=1 Tax=Vibrio phage douglas 12A4 TaxID=573171 RepID=UPI0002C12899|nr:hypothetical protein VPAG_00007 [Vibrio phage douglas 12A4]AGG58043.1 hypothetical protein VPAG_00007 [Vibrio phage douglas 12A4]
MSLLFGEDSDDEDFEQSEDETVEEQDDVNDDQPEVIDTTKAQGSDTQSNDEEPTSDSDENVKEIDGKLYVAVDATNSQIVAKGGKHNIPYEVLERARTTSSESQAKIKELEDMLNEKNGQFEMTEKKRQIAERQLQEAGIDLEKMPEEVLNDPEALQRIKDELPGEAGQIIEALVGRLKINETQNQAPKEQPEQPEQQASSNQGNPVDEALASEALKELNDWKGGDSDRWDMALIIDKQLQNNPDFAQVPIHERFAEVQRRTKLAFGDPVQAGIDQELAAQKVREEQVKNKQQVIPNSPSEISSGERSQAATGHQALFEQDAMALEQAMAGMTDAEMEAFLEEAGASFD